MVLPTYWLPSADSVSWCQHVYNAMLCKFASCGMWIFFTNILKLLSVADVHNDEYAITIM